MTSPFQNKNKKKQNASTSSLLALSAFWQSQLKVLCQTAEFHVAGRLPAVSSPCSLITIEPFTPGGLRRLCINVHSPFIQRLANLLTTNGSSEDIVFRIGEILLSSGSWPVPYVDGDVHQIWWGLPPGLIATPHELNIWPVPHQETSDCLSPPHLSLTTWPKRICAVGYKLNVANPGQRGDFFVEYAYEKWQLRDKALQLELDYLLKVQKSRHRSWSSRRLLQSIGHNNTSSLQEDVENSLSSCSLLTFSPSLPIFCIAQALQQTPHFVPRNMAIGEASMFLVEHDRLFALSLFFKVPLIDRTRTLHGALRTAPYVRPPPTKDEVQQFEKRSRSGSDGDDGENGAHSVLRTIMLQRARELWEITEATKKKDHRSQSPRGKIYVAWSGGIDSTSVICALLETAKEDGNGNNLFRQERLCIVMDDKSIGENPSFYQDIIEKQSIETVNREEKPLSWHEARIRQEHSANIFVTGELADQLFGSDKCGDAFPDAYAQGPDAQDLPADLAKKAPLKAPAKYRGIFADLGLSAPWQETILPSLDSVGMLAKRDEAAWEEWIAPQLALAPFPIISTYDFLWWMNFSMKWQNVSLRCLHDGGTPLLEQAESVHDLKGCIHHFFDDRDMQCWSCVSEFHKCKFPDLTDWKTYKEPLKYFIRTVDGNEEYYQNKIKVGSLGFGAPDVVDSYVNRFHGALAQVDVGPEKAITSRSATKGDEKIIWEAKPSLLSWGACGLLVPSSEGLPHLLHHEFRRTLSTYPNDASETIEVDPWNLETSGATSPFKIAPFFAEDDERQRRIFNPITANTLIGKCSALLCPDIISGKTFLDLGACLGASTHWALSMGASYATAVEIQKNFCHRANEMLKRAEKLDCWPGTTVVEGQSRFSVVHRGVREYLAACADHSHDVILAAGLLHCFVDPSQILMEICRVASHAVLIEMVHPALYTDGYLDDLDEPNTKNGSLRDSVRPIPRRIEQGGLLQIAPGALVNMADDDASFQGLAILPSRLAIESMMKALGFRVTRVKLLEHPTNNEDVITYTKPRRFRALSNRYFLRCVRVDAAKEVARSIPSLETAISKDDKKSKIRWTDKISWYEKPRGSSLDEVSESRKSYEEIVVNDDPSKQWEFDATVARRFTREAMCHIPDYVDVVEDSIAFLEAEMEKNKTKGRKETCRVVDIGCATGYTLLQLAKRGFRNIHGVDIASAMLEVAKEEILGKEYEKCVTLHLSQDPLDLPLSLGDGIDAAFVNWTLQFVPDKEERKSFLRNIASRMCEGALLVLTEKTTQNSLTKDAYYGFKKCNGVSEKEIEVKEKKLKGVLVTFSVAWYLEALSECGFTDVVLHRAHYGFVTLVARRDGLNEMTRAISESLPIKTRSDGEFVTWVNISHSAKDVFYQTQMNTAPFVMKAWGESTDSSWSGGFEMGTVYGFVYEGPAKIRMGSNMSFTLHKDMYFSCPGHVTVQGGCGSLCIVEDHRALFSMGGPVENGEGRLPYIDGCTDTLLLPPVLKGAPCLNHLHFPSGIKQTRHSHPSARAGVVIRGRGICIFDTVGNMESEEPQYQNVPLEAGMAFVIPANLLHAFETSGEEELDVIAFHPDSDFGPSPLDHPMINRTIVDGVSASSIKAIQTQM